MLTDPSSHAADDIRRLVSKIRADMQAGFCTPERLEANLAAIELAALDLDECPPMELTDAALREIGRAIGARTRRAGRFQVLDGGKA